MSRKQRHTPEQVIGKLREAEVKLAKGTAIAQVCKDLSITENAYCRWRREYGGMKVDQARRLKELEKENGRPKRAAGRRRAGQGDPAGGRHGKILSPARRREAVEHAKARSARIASRSAGPARSWGSAARRSGARPPCRTTSPG